MIYDLAVGLLILYLYRKGKKLWKKIGELKYPWNK